jgi:hypothetical protein
LLVDVTNFIGAGQIGLNQGQLRNPDNPDHILERAAADKIRNYCDTYCRNRLVTFLPRACLPRPASMASSCAWIFFLSNKQAEDYFAALGYQQAAQTGVLSPSRRLLQPAKPGHRGDGMCSGCGVAWSPHHRASPRRCSSPPLAPPHGLQ